MDWILKKLRGHKLSVSIILAFLGVIMIAFAKDNSVISAIGISILASAITSLVTILFIDDEDEYRAAKEWGLEHVYPTRGEMNAASDHYLRTAKSLKTVAFGMRSLRDAKTEDVKKILERGGTVRILTMDPNCRNLKEREKDEKHNTIGDSIRDLIKWARALNEGPARGKIEVRMHDHLPLDFMFLMNNRLFTGPYVYGKLSQQTVSFEYNTVGKAYEYYEALFDSLWENKDFCRDALCEIDSEA